MESDPEKRRLFLKTIENMPKSRLVYIDECGIDHSINKDRGWGRKGEVLKGKKSGKYYHRTNIIGALVGNQPIASMSFYGTCCSQVFNDWVKNVLVKNLIPNQVVIMDNASFHKSKNTKRLIKEAGCQLLYLPPYSPDLNPIEQFWANMKRFVKNQRNTYSSIFAAVSAFFQKCKGELMVSGFKKLKLKK